MRDEKGRFLKGFSGHAGGGKPWGHVRDLAKIHTEDAIRVLAEIMMDPKADPAPRARREAQQILAAAERPAPTVREDLQAVRRRPWDAPMATPVHQLPQPPAPMICGVSGLPDPLATLAWDAVVADTAQTARSWWARVQAPLAFAVWSAACFLLGWLA